MDNQLQRYSVRGVATDAVEKINEIAFVTRLPSGAIIEDAVELLWKTMNFDSQEVSICSR